MSVEAIPAAAPTEKVTGSGRVAIVAALDREVRPLVRNWPGRVREFAGRRFEVFEEKGAVVICGGIGAEAARRAAEAVISLYGPQKIISAGFAGALAASLKVGDIFVARYIVDVADGSSFDTGTGDGRLVSFASVANREQKEKLARAYDAQAVDMEAAAVARCAEIHGLEFLAVKAISDEKDATLAEITRFIEHGQIRLGPFLIFMTVRPWLWPGLFRLARQSAKASQALRRSLNHHLAAASLQERN